MNASNLPEVYRAQMDLAKALATSELLGRAYHQRPQNILLVTDLGRALGIEPSVALTNVHVIDGTPQLSAQLQAALVRRAGHKLRVNRNPDGSVTAILVRRDDPDYEHTATWSMAKAAAAGLTGKGAWKQYPDQMLANRATTEVIRLGASDVLLGCYDPEELEPTPQPGVLYTITHMSRADEPADRDVDTTTGEILDDTHDAEVVDASVVEIPNTIEVETLGYGKVLIDFDAPFWILQCATCDARSARKVKDEAIDAAKNHRCQIPQATRTSGRDGLD